MKLGISISGDRSVGSAVSIASLADRLGFAEVWITEDYCERGSFVVAAAVAAATTDIRVGIGVVNPWTRHPVLTAMEFAALDELSEGRAILGLGTSNQRWMQDQLGIPFERPLDTLEETLAILRSALAGRHVAYRGTKFQVDARLAFRPPRERPPIFLGVKRPRGIEFARRLADGILLSTLSNPAYVGWARARAGDDTHLAAYVEFACDSDAGAAMAVVRPVVARFLAIHGNQPITELAGVDVQLIETLQASSMEGPVRVDLVDDHVVQAFAIAGDQDDCVEAVRRFEQAGLDTLLVRDNVDLDPESLLRDAKLCFETALA